MRMQFKRTAMVAHLGFEPALPQPVSTVRNPAPASPFYKFCQLYKDAMRQTYCAVSGIDPAEKFTAYKTTFTLAPDLVKFEFSSDQHSTAFFDFFRTFCREAGAEMDTMVTDNYCSIRAVSPPPLINLLADYIRQDKSGCKLSCLDDAQDIDFRYVAEGEKQVDTDKALAAYLQNLPIQIFNSAAEAALVAQTMEAAALPFSLKHMCASILEHTGRFPEALQPFRLH